MNLFDHPHTIECPRLIGHRGFTPVAPENSLPSFTAAGMLGLWAIETDVHKTSDGVLVCCHNSSTGKMYNEDVVIEETAFADLQKLYLDTGVGADIIPRELLRMPTFAEYMAICKKYGAVAFIETKGAVVGEVLDYVERDGMTDMSVLSSAEFEHIEEARRLSDKIFIHHIFSNEQLVDRLSELGYSGCSFNLTDLDSLPKGLIRRTHAKGVKCCLRAADSIYRGLRMLELGLDYIPTNNTYKYI